MILSLSNPLLAVRGHLDIGRLQIAVDDALLMRGFQGFCDLKGQFSSTGIGPFFIWSASVSPSTSSTTGKIVPSDSSSPWIAAMLVWLSDASSLASRWQRATRSESLANSSDRTLIATCRAFNPSPDIPPPCRLCRAGL